MGQRNNEPKTFEDAFQNLTDKQKKFVQLYLDEPNAEKAARGAGYVEGTSARAIRRGADVSKAIELGFASIMSREEVMARIEMIATCTMEDFISIERVKKIDERLYNVDNALELIADLIASEKEKLQGRINLAQQRAIKNEIRRLERVKRVCVKRLDDISLAELEGKKKPDKSMFLPIEYIEEVQTKTDLEKAQRRGKLHLIKKIKQTKNGVEVELYGQDWALELLAKHYGLLEVQESKDVHLFLTRKIVTGGAKEDD